MDLLMQRRRATFSLRLSLQYVYLGHVCTFDVRRVPHFLAQLIALLQQPDSWLGVVENSIKCCSMLQLRASLRYPLKPNAFRQLLRDRC